MTDDHIRILLDATDKLIKAAAVLIGGAWTWRNYTKTKPYALKLDLSIEASAFFQSEWFLPAIVSAKNIGTTRLNLKSEGTACELFAILENMSETQLDAV